MASPLQEILSSPKDIIMDKLKSIIPELGMQLSGFRHDLGLMSIESDTDVMLYAHIVELSEGETKITIAPGLSKLKERDQSEVPESTVAKILERLRVKLQN